MLDTACVAPIAPTSALQFMRVVGQLKTLKRTGWVHSGVALPESVADHMYRMSVMAMLITDASVNKDKLVKICLMHDVAEAVVGDITPYQGVGKEEKRKLEEDAFHSITRALGSPAIEKELFSLWIEYEDGTSLESDVARQLDKYEMVVQADDYERAQGMQLDDFFRTTENYFTHPEIKAWDETIRSERRARLAAAAAPPS